ncbi:HBS1-like protein [Chytriomyces cf. hyalinus JEL632]|nr:HBS1-like protein [Chytriomyces cf. hyalinus JEL632]
MQYSGMTLASLSASSLKSGAVANPSLSLTLNSTKSEKTKPTISTVSSISNLTAPKLTLGQMSTKQTLPTSSSSNIVISSALSAMSLSPSLTSKPILLVPKTASSNVALSTLSALSQSKNPNLQPSKLPMTGAHASSFSKLPTQMADLKQQQQQEQQQQKLQPAISSSTARSDLQSSSSAVAAPASSLAFPSPAGSATSSQAPVSNVSIKPAPQPSIAKGKRIDVVQEYAKRNLEKSSLNLVVVGHVDAGKSTLMGHLLYLLGEVNERTMKKYERDAEKMKKGSFCFAWALDETEEERSRGVTIDVGMSYFETQLHRFTILDAPGHRDFVPNMISGASQADVALLVIDSGTGEFEVGFELGGQTREHALLVRSLGVAQLVVAVNKLDTMHWSESRFCEIKEKLTLFLLRRGFTGENMIECKSQELLAWYEGPTLRECLDALQPPVRPLEKPFRLPVTDYFKGGSTAGGGGSLSISGRIEAGTLQIGDAVTVMPLGEHGVVKAIESNNEAIKWAVAGDNVVIALNGIDVQQISIGNVLCAPQSLVPVADVFQVKIVTFDIAIPLTLGVPIVLHHQSASTPGIISKLVSILNRASGEVIKKNPRALPKNVTAIVDIKLDESIWVELAKESRELGRVMIRFGSTVVAAGIVTEIVNRVK